MEIRYNSYSCVLSLGYCKGNSTIQTSSASSSQELTTVHGKAGGSPLNSRNRAQIYDLKGHVRQRKVNLEWWGRVAMSASGSLYDWIDVPLIKEVHGQILRLCVTVADTQENNLVGGKMDSASQFQIFPSMVRWLHCLDPVAKRAAHSQEVVEDQSGPPQSIQKAVWKQEVSRDKISFTGRPLVTDICQPEPTS